MITIYKKGNNYVYCCFKFNKILNGMKSSKFIFYFGLGNKSIELTHKELKFLKYENNTIEYLDFNLCIVDYFVSDLNYERFIEEIIKIKNYKNIIYSFDTTNKKLILREIIK